MLVGGGRGLLVAVGNGVLVDAGSGDLVVVGFKVLVDKPKGVLLANKDEVLVRGGTIVLAGFPCPPGGVFVGIAGVRFEDTVLV